MKVTGAQSTDVVVDMDVRGESERKVQDYPQISDLPGGTDAKVMDPGQSIKEEEQIWKEMTRCIFKKLINLFILGCTGSSLLRTGFSLVAASRGYPSLRCTDFSFLTAVASLVVEHGL